MPGVMAALALAARGLAVVALPPGGRRPAPGWQAAATTDPDKLASAWRDGDNLGVACRASGLVVLDLDRHPGGPDGVAQLLALAAAAAEQLPITLTVATPPTVAGTCTSGRRRAS